MAGVRQARRDSLRGLPLALAVKIRRPQLNKNAESIRRHFRTILSNAARASFLPRITK